ADVAGADEALLLNTNGFVVEGASSNLFWIEGDTICSPPLASGILPGVTRAVVLAICKILKLRVREIQILPDELRKVEGIFVSLSSFGIAEGVSLNGVICNRSAVPEKLFRAYQDILKRENP